MTRHVDLVVNHVQSLSLFLFTKPTMTDPKPPNNFSCEGDSPEYSATVDGAPVEEFNDTPGSIIGDQIVIRLGF